MEKTMLFAGKALPDANDFVESAISNSRNVTVAIDDADAKNQFTGKMAGFAWQRTSPVSARTFVLQSETAFGKVDEAVLFFDENYYASQFEALTIEECSRAHDTATIGYQYLTMELLTRFEKSFLINPAQEAKVAPGKLVFVIKNSLEEIDLVKNPSLRNTAPCAGPFVASAAKAFAAFAESVAALYGGKDYVSVILVRADNANEVMKKDSDFASWLCGYLDSIDGLKSKPSLKQSVSWIKAGAKAGGLASLFK